MSKKHIAIFAVFALLSVMIIPPARAAEDDAVIRDIVFPTEATVTFTDDFGEPRSGHAHEGIDMMGPKMTPLYAAVDGRVQSVNIPEKSWGMAIVLQDDDGYTYHYLHVNNDTPGTDDGQGGPEYAYAPGIERRARVTRGQLIGWMGDSGNAEDIASHLHFEIRFDGVALNPYPSLMAALNKEANGTVNYDVDPSTPPSDGVAQGDTVNYDVKIALDASPNINTDKGLVTEDGDAPCESGSLVKSPLTSAVYYCGANGKRYVFPNDRIYFTWYDDFDEVTEITTEELAAIPLGGNVTYKPGSKMVKIESLPNVYAVEQGGVLRWVKSPSVAAILYGDEWAKNVDDLSDAFFGNYKFGADIDYVN